jgi:hypothetical protein
MSTFHTVWARAVREGKDFVAPSSPFLDRAATAVPRSPPAPVTSGKTGFHSEHLSRTKFDPRLKGPSVSVHLKMWARGH